MNRLWQRLVAVGVIGIASLGAATAAPPSKEEIAKAIRQLGDNDFTVREEAVAFLRKAGRHAEPALKAALKDPDFEVVRRAKDILEDFRWGIYPDTPKNVLEQIQRYRGANDTGTRLDAADQLTRLTTPGYTALLKIAAAEDNAELRQSLFHRVARGVSHIVADLLVDEQHDQVEELLELSLISQDEAAQRHYAAYLYLRKQLDAKIPAIKNQAAQVDGKRAAELLAQLYRAKGNLAAAREAAEKAESPGLATQFLMESGDWKELIKRALAEQDPPVESLGYLAAYQRLAGAAADYDKTIEQLRKLANGDDTSTSWLAAKALFLNDRTQDALDALVATKSYRPVFDVLAHQLKYAEAMETAKNLAVDHPQRFEVDLRRAAVLQNLGEKEAALQLFAKLADELEARTDLVNLAGHRDLIKAELRAGLTDLAFTHTGRFLARSKLDDITKQLLEELFPQQANSATIWWTGLRGKHAQEKPEETLARLRAIFMRKQTPTDFPTTADGLLQYLPMTQPTPVDKQMLALADACQALGKAELEKSMLERSALAEGSDGTARLRLGDLLAGKKDWLAAAEQYRLSWEKDKSKPLGLYLQGHALVQAGKEEGKKRMELAHWLPLASEAARFDFAAALAERGFAEAARGERDLILRSGASNGWHANETLRMVAYDAMYRKDYVQAAQLFEQFRLRCLRASVGFVQYSAYVQVPVLVHENRALAALTAGKLDEARAAIRACFQLVPGNVDLPIRFVAELDRQGKNADADDIFGQAFSQQEKLVAQYPQAAAGHNTIAWLCACSRRQLDKGLKHAQKAVALAPNQAGYADTLAEVHFQRGEPAKAIELMKKCLDLEPNSTYFQRQLKRFQAGDPKAEIPEH